MSTFREDVESAVLADDKVVGIVRDYMRTCLACLLTARDVAAKEHVAQSTVYSWRRSGRLDGVRVVGRWAFEPAAVARLERELKRERARQVAA